MAEQRTIDWFQVRLGKATASRFADVLAKTRSGASMKRANYLAQLVTERLTGVLQDSYQNPAMLWGIETEATARLAYESETGNDVIEQFFVEHPVVAAGCSPDGFVGDDGQVEIKCPNTATHLATLHSEALPTDYVPQVQGQLWITGRKWCDFVSFDPRLPLNAQLFVIRIYRDEGYIKRLDEEVSLFLDEVEKEVSFVQSYGKTPAKTLAGSDKQAKTSSPS